MKELIILVFIASFGMFINEVKAESVDLREYYPSHNQTNTFINDDGQIVRRFKYSKVRKVKSVWNMRKPGYFYQNSKQVWTNGRWENTAVAMLFMGNDKSVTEVGGYLANHNNAVESFTSKGKPTGINWGHVGGLRDRLETKEFKISANGEYINQKAYSSSKLIERLDYYKPEKSNKTYKDVVHIVVYHGTSVPGTKVVRCGNAYQIRDGAVQYKSYKNYNSYAIEQWMAKGVGVIKSTNVFIENPKTFFKGSPTCSGNLFDRNNTFTSYIVD